LFNVDFNFASLASNMGSVGASSAIQKECFGCDNVGTWEGTLCPQCASAGTSETIQEKNAKVLQQLSSAVDELKGKDGTSQHAVVHLAHLQKQKALHDEASAQDDISFKQKLAGASSAYLHAKSQNPALQLQVSCGDNTLGIFEQFNPTSAASVVVQKAFQYGEFKYISSPARCLEVSSGEERELHIESIQSDLHCVHPQQLHVAFTYNEFLQFVRQGSIPEARGEYYNSNIFMSISEALQFHGFVTRDFKVDASEQLLSSHDLYFVSFFIEDKNLQLALSSKRFTVFDRSGHSKMFKVNKEYFLSASEMRLHELSTMVFNTGAYWAATQRTS
jgi:hypothetical protein